MSRELFEKWAKYFYKEQQMSRNSDKHFHSPNEYMLPHYQSAWEAWQACAEEKDKRIAELEEKRIMQLSAISTASIGYFKDGDSIHDDYDTTALRDVTKLHARYTELNAQNKELVEALKDAKEAIRAWHGIEQWDIYDRCSPEMKRINEALAKMKGE